MKQVLLRRGKISIADVPAPALGSRRILVEVSRSLISTGTEISTIQTSGASLVEKAMARPAAVAKAIESIKVRGFRRTFSMMQTRLDELHPLGYSCAGTVIAVADDVTEFQAGDRVACGGSGLANHAEIVSIPVTLAAKIPAGVSDVSASFVTLGAIALQGVRRADVRLGETVAVIGLGLLGQITAQLLKAAGCRVIGLDPDSARVERALESGLTAGLTNANELKAAGENLTGGHGVDATIITASSPSSDPTRLSFHITRKKGRIVVVGAVGMDLERSPFYEKEQDFLISCSYGPGRYDPSYESQARDYPYAFVRWTESRNMSAFLDLVAAGGVRVEALAEKTFSLLKADEAYASLQVEPKPLAVVLTYEGAPAKGAITGPRTTAALAGRVRLGIIGAGAFARGTHLPNLKFLSDRVKVTAICAASSASAAATAAQAGATLVATDYNDVLKSTDVDAVLISTRHDSHASIAIAALKVGKHVFLEKPLALTMEELNSLDETIRSLPNCPVLMVGFNRRFSLQVKEVISRLAQRTSSLVATYRVNAGALAPDHWANGAQGGGRLRGEACHMIDLFQALVGKPLEQVSLTALRGSSAARPDENFSAQFQFEDGSLADLVYTSVGNSGLPKERIEVHWDGQSAVIDDFKALSIHGGSAGNWSGVQEKGHLAALEEFLAAISSGKGFPIPWEELYASAQAAIALDAQAWGKAAANGPS